MPSAKLIDFTGCGTSDPAWYAAEILLFTKETRLAMNPARRSAIAALSNEEKLAALREMAKTIPSSWEFVTLTFMFSDVTRACAQQITRTRTGSYAMQSLRVVDASEIPVTNPFEPGDPKAATFDRCKDLALLGYKRMIAQGAEAQDARGILPLNTNCNLLAKYDLRAFVDLVRSRSSLRTQEEYAALIRSAVDAVKAVWPWVDVFLSSPHDAAIAELEGVARELGITPGSGLGWRVAKALDLLRKK